MSLILREVTRTIKVATETTLQTDDPNADTVAFNLAPGDYFYIGSRYKFAHRYFHLSTLNATANTLTLKYWDGEAWTAVKDLVDQTRGFTRNGFVSWQNYDNWQKTTVAPVDYESLYWVRLEVSAGLDAGTLLQSVLNTYVDDALLRRYWPELLSDSRYLPDGRTDFLEQYIAASELVALRLKQDKIIEHGSQIIDPNEVAVACAHAAAHIILTPITNPEEDHRAAEAERKMNHELNRVRLSLDLDKSGIIEEDERNYADVYVPRGGY